MTKIILVLVAILLPVITNADNPTYTPMVNIPFIDGDMTIEDYTNAIYLLSISVAAVLAVLKITIAGVKYIMSDVVTSKESAKKDIKGALFGLLIVLAAVVILQTINPQLTQLDILATGRTGEIAASPTTGSHTSPSIPASCDVNSAPRYSVTFTPPNHYETHFNGCAPRVNQNQVANLTAEAARYLELQEELDAIVQGEMTAASQARLKEIQAEIQEMVNGSDGESGNGGGAAAATGVCANRAPGSFVTSSGGQCAAGTNFVEDVNDGTDSVSGGCYCPNI